MFQDLREAQQEFGELLKKNESIKWAAKPKQGFLLKPSDRYLIPFSLFWCGFVFTWEYITWNMATGLPIMALFGIPFVLVGIYLLVGRYFMDASIRKHTFYVMTDKRIMVRTGVWNISTDVYRFQDLRHIQFTERADGSGTILISPLGIPFPQVGGKDGAALPQGTIRFEFIEEVKSVYLMLQEKMEVGDDTNSN